jgi:hypothetical protein
MAESFAPCWEEASRMLRREFIKGVKAGEVKFPDQTLSVPPGVAPVLGSMLDQLLPESDVLGALSATDPESDCARPVVWYLVLPRLLVKIVGSIEPSAEISDESTLSLDHDFLPVARITKVSARVDRLTHQPGGGTPCTALEMLHDNGTWAIELGECLDSANARRFTAVLLREMAR